MLQPPHTFWPKDTLLQARLWHCEANVHWQMIGVALYNDDDNDDDDNNNNNNNNPSSTDTQPNKVLTISPSFRLCVCGPRV